MLKIVINNIESKGVVDTGADVSIISPESWPAIWPLVRDRHPICKELGLHPKFKGKKSTRWLKCAGPEYEIGKSKAFVPDIPRNVWGRDLLQQ